MIMRRVAAVCLGLLLCLAPLAGSAQGDQTADADWQRVAIRAEALAARDDASQFAVTRLRAELVTWRDEFLSLSDANSGRIATVDAQLEALGDAPESGDEPQAVADRRAALINQRQQLVAPGLLAQEAYARANGLISEFDAIVLQRQAIALTERGSSPLNPSHMVEALTTILGTLGEIGSETVALLDQRIESGQFVAVLPRAILFMLIATLCLGMARRWVTAWRMRIAAEHLLFAPFWLLLVSLAQFLSLIHI